MQYRLLGPIEVAREDGPLPLGGGKQRALLADLALHANRVVASEQLLEDLWGDEPQTSAGHALQVYVSRLRKVLRDGADGGEILVTKPPGYMLQIGPDDTLDIDRFEIFHDEGRRLVELDPAGALERFEAALGLWRGPALGDLATESFASPTAARLEDLRRSTAEGRLEAKLALGLHEDVAAEGPAMVAADPLRERTWGLLMLALYRCGRQAEALQAYQDARERLSDELGVDPGPELSKLQTAILQHDPSLDFEPRPTAVVGPAPSAPTGARPRTPSRRWPRVAVGVAALALAGGIAVALVLTLRPDGEPTEIATVGPNSLISVDVASGRIRAVAPTGDDPIAMTVSGTTAWVANFGDRTVSAIDLDTGGEVAHVGGVGIPTAIALGLGSVWVADSFAGTISQIDAQTKRVVRQISSVGAPTGLAVGFGSLWATDPLGGRVVRLDETGQIVDTVRTPPDWAPTLIAVGGGAVWVASGVQGLVARLDPEMMRFVRDAIAVCCQPSAIAATDDAVWLISEVQPHVVRIDPA
ncbi:MAG: BTAD domain-containing putative transcriptional regulator, partial [Solirubrobacterales bacterium]